MNIVDALLGGVIGQLVQKVPDVVQQAGGHKVWSQTSLARQIGALERMLPLGDRLASVLGTP